MDLGFDVWGEAQRVFGYLESNGLEKSDIVKWAKSISPCCIRPVARRSGIKKGQPRTVDLRYLVEGTTTYRKTVSKPALLVTP